MERSGLFRFIGLIFHDAVSFTPNNSIDKNVVDEEKYQINENILIQFFDDI